MIKVTEFLEVMLDTCLLAFPDCGLNDSYIGYPTHLGIQDKSQVLPKTWKIASGWGVHAPKLTDDALVWYITALREGILSEIYRQRNTPDLEVIISPESMVVVFRWLQELVALTLGENNQASFWEEKVRQAKGIYLAVHNLVKETGYQWLPRKVREEGHASGLEMMGLQEARSHTSFVSKALSELKPMPSKYDYQGMDVAQQSDGIQDAFTPIEDTFAPIEATFIPIEEKPQVEEEPRVRDEPRMDSTYIFENLENEFRIEPTPVFEGPSNENSVPEDESMAGVAQNVCEPEKVNKVVHVPEIHFQESKQEIENQSEDGDPEGIADAEGVVDTESVVDTEDTENVVDTEDAENLTQQLDLMDSQLAMLAQMADTVEQNMELGIANPSPFEEGSDSSYANKDEYLGESPFKIRDGDSSGQDFEVSPDMQARIDERMRKLVSE